MLNASDVTESTRRRYRGIFEDYVRIQDKSRFIQKHTGFARIRYLKAIFPDALFIHVYRDGCAIANSMNNVNWWTGDLDTCWWWSDMKPEYIYAGVLGFRQVTGCACWYRLEDSQGSN